MVKHFDDELVVGRVERGIGWRGAGAAEQVVGFRRVGGEVIHFDGTEGITLQQRLDQQAAGADEPVVPVPLSPGVQRAVSYLERNQERRVPLADLVAIATARGVPQFCARFKREVGVPPAPHHLRLRLEAARSALRQPAFDILTTALHFGFSSSQHFSTQFRRAFGVTPGDWRKRGR